MVSVMSLLVAGDEWLADVALGSGGGLAEGLSVDVWPLSGAGLAVGKVVDVCGGVGLAFGIKGKGEKLMVGDVTEGTKAVLAFVDETSTVGVGLDVGKVPSASGWAMSVALETARFVGSGGSRSLDAAGAGVGLGDGLGAGEGAGFSGRSLVSSFRNFSFSSERTSLASSKAVIMWA